MVISEDRLEQSDSPELLTRACAGEADAFCRLTEPLQIRLFRQAVALSGNESAAEDLVSETLIEAWKSLPRFNRSCRLSTWLYAILLHRHRKALCRAQSRPISLAWLPFFHAQDLHDQLSNQPSAEPSPAEAVEQNETSAKLRRCIDSLPDKHREVILLRFYEDASLPDIALVLGCSTGTVKSRLHHALEKLRQMKMNLSDLKGDKQV